MASSKGNPKSVYPTPDVTPPRTPTSTATAAHTLLAEIQSIYSALQTLPSLAPGPIINDLLTRLVNLCTQPYSTTFLGAFLELPGIEQLSEELRILCAEAEGELERYWAQKIVGTLETKVRGADKQDKEKEEAKNEDTVLEGKRDNSKITNPLAQFPYRQNYINLSRLECSMLSAFLPSRSNPTIAFIGSGPLPVTSLCLLDAYPHATVHNIDRDISAIALSQQLTQTLGAGYAERMRFSCCDVSDELPQDLELAGTKSPEMDWRAFDVVFLAALVGMDKDDKIAILRLLARRLQKGTLVVARSAREMRSLLYPVLEISDELLSCGFEVLAEVHPWTEVVNSVVVLRVRDC